MHSVIPCVSGTAVSVAKAGIYYVPCWQRASGNNPIVLLRDPVTGKDSKIGRLENYRYDRLPSGFAVSPNGRTILYTRLVSRAADLMMIENFK